MADQAESRTARIEDRRPHPASLRRPPPAVQSARKFIIIGVVLLLVLGAVFFYWRSTFTEDTDDAQVDGNLYQVSSRITGQVIKVYVDDNQTVQAGQLLAEIDPTRLPGRPRPGPGQPRQRPGPVHPGHRQRAHHQRQRRHQRQHLQAPTSAAQADSVAQAQKQVEAAKARVDQAKANAVKAQLDVDRYTPLVQKDVISKQQYDAAVAQRCRRQGRRR